MGSRLKYSTVSLLAEKINIGIIGAGKAGLIKARHFINQGVHVHILSKEESRQISELVKNNNAILEVNEYYRDFILDKHLIIIAVDDKRVAEIIRVHCNELSKIFIDATNFKYGLAIVPIQRETRNLVASVNLKEVNPKGAIFIADRIKRLILEYDRFIEFTTLVRKEVKNKEKIKLSVLEFIYCEDFIFFFNKNKEKKVLELFYGKNTILK